MRLARPAAVAAAALSARRADGVPGQRRRTQRPAVRQAVRTAAGARRAGVGHQHRRRRRHRRRRHRRRPQPRGPAAGKLVAGRHVHRLQPVLRQRRLEGPGRRRRSRATPTAPTCRASRPPRPTTASASPASRPDAKIMPVKVLEDGSGAYEDIANGVRWAADHGADVINMSLGGLQGTQAAQPDRARDQPAGRDPLRPRQGRRGHRGGRQRQRPAVQLPRLRRGRALRRRPPTSASCARPSPPARSAPT